ncbi:hypothetical protein MTR67_031190 [Solanum verrucosum]|uniref:Uncharacterized protein n=1 Tax=Solanum verrucosum TaxID=315347 RepID=A0AAF0ZFP1_SOLVR|nr:hypothetical protein MTR67_031190 [Solanum verrucosum]
MMTQLDFLSKHVINDGFKSVNTVGTRTRHCPEDAKFDTLYNEEVQYTGNQMRGSHLNYPRLGRNQGWTKEMDNF